MEKKINIAELLKDCPKGMELYSPIFGTVYFEGIRDTGRAILIDVTTSCNTSVQFYSDGKFNTYYSESEVTLFPSKSQRDWSKFQRPFKDGDIVATQGGEWLGITKNETSCGKFNMHCAVNCIYHNEFHTRGEYCFSRLATEEEKQKLFKAIKDNGYKWNAETKTLEELIKPKFKIGDRIRIIGTTGVYVVTEVREHYYIIDDKDMRVYFTNQDQWELAPNKFDITTLKPFESRVLVRDDEDSKWVPAFWGFYDNDNKINYPYTVVGDNYFKQCIPYENNEHLLETTDDCDEFYKTWK